MLQKWCDFTYRGKDISKPGMFSEIRRFLPHYTPEFSLPYKTTRFMNLERKLNQQSDRKLIEEILDGNTESYSILVSRYTRSVIGVARKVIRDQHLAEDVAQDSFVIAFEKLPSLRNRNRFGPWLLQITRHQAINILRKEVRVKETVSSSMDSTSIPERFTGSESGHLLDLIDRLPEHEKSVIMLKYFEGYSVDEIAQITSQKIGTITKKLSRARNRLIKLSNRSE